VEVVGARLGDQEESTRLPLIGISADKGRQPRIEAIQVESEDGTTTLLTFQHVPPTQTERELPGGA